MGSVPELNQREGQRKGSSFPTLKGKKEKNLARGQKLGGGTLGGGR